MSQRNRHEIAAPLAMEALYKAETTLVERTLPDSFATDKVRSVSVREIDLPSLRTGCQRLAKQKYGDVPSPYISARLNANYYSPEDYYEALLDKLVDDHQTWLDIGCGRAPFPNNLELSDSLAKRSSHFVGIDPDSNVVENPYVHERHQLTLEEFVPRQAFDLVTARMVVEHVERPKAFVESLARVTWLDSRVILFTVNWWSITALSASFTPMFVHHWMKNRLWNTNEGDTFQTSFKMNRRSTLDKLMTAAGFEECFFEVLPDASLFWRLPGLRHLELSLFRAMRARGVPYFDSCVLAVYRRASVPESQFR